MAAPILRFTRWTSDGVREARVNTVLCDSDPVPPTIIRYVCKELRVPLATFGVAFDDDTDPN